MSTVETSTSSEATAPVPLLRLLRSALSLAIIYNCCSFNPSNFFTADIFFSILLFNLSSYFKSFNEFNTNYFIPILKKYSCNTDFIAI